MTLLKLWIALIGGSIVASASPELLLNFENDTLENFISNRSQILWDSLSQSQILRLRYPVGCVGTSRAKGCAIQIRKQLPDPGDVMWVSYDVFVESGFDFARGGKLPGLCGGKCYTGGHRPTIGDGWSARIMWRENGALEQYVYYADQSGKYGDRFKWNLSGTIPQKKITPNQWNKLVTKVTLNSVSAESHGEKNGRIQSWFNGELVLDIDTLRLRSFSSQQIDQLYISTFHGGHTPSWGPSVESFIRFDNFLVSRDSISLSK